MIDYNRMTDSHERPAYIDKIGTFDAVEILVNEKKKLLLKGSLIRSISRSILKGS